MSALMHLRASVWAVTAGLLMASPSLADDASRLATAREIVTITHAADNMKALLPQIMTAMRPILMHQGADQATADALITDVEARVTSQVGELTDLFANIYAQEFTEDDLNSLLAFYRTPAGQHFIDKQPSLMRGSLAIGQRWGQMVAKQVLDDYAKRKAGTSPLTP